MSKLDIVDETVGTWGVSSVVFGDESERLCVPVTGIIGNPVPTSAPGKRKLTEWKKAVASAAKDLRGTEPLDPNWHHCITAGFSFHPASHGGAALDVENFLKPSFDALAAGLFCANDQDPREIERYDYDDSNFRYLFVHRLDDAESEDREGAAFVISIRK
jgi:hypothetical protein